MSISDTQLAQAMKQIGEVLAGLQKDESPQAATFTSEERVTLLELARKASPYLSERDRAALESATSEDVTVLVVAAA